MGASSQEAQMERDPRPAGDYGIDAAWVPWMWIGYAVLYVFLSVASAVWWGAFWWVTVLLAVVALVFVLGAILYWYVTFRGKFAVWSELLDDVRVAENTRALDLGCGHGAVAIEVARRFPTVVVDGIDLWRSVDQSGNSPEALERNASLNGVRDRIVVTTGDMTALPYADESFALVTASMAIHNIPSADGRKAAVLEAWRVLDSGGALILVDIRRAAEYARVLRATGADVPEPAPIGWRMWWSGPWMATKRLSVVKP
jgi:arsenite methyltransferase